MSSTKQEETSSASSKPASSESIPQQGAWFEKENRKYNTRLAKVGYLIFLGTFVFATLLPLLVILLAIGLYFGLISRLVFSIFIGLIALDFCIPIQNGYRPNLERAQNIFRFLGEGGAAYFPAKTVCNAADLSKEKSYILASWPHSLLGGGCHFCFVDFHLQGFHVILSGASVLDYIPLLRRFAHACGACDVSKKSLSKVLNIKKYGPTYPYNIVHLVVGGIGEMFYTNNNVAGGGGSNTNNNSNKEQIILKKRKGFIKLALETGADIIPHYSFGANQAYFRPLGPKSIMAKLSSLSQVSLVFWFGRWWIPMGVVPFPVPIMSVMGEVFEVPNIDDPQKITRELVDEVHQQFCSELKKLFDKYKVVYVEEMGAPKEWLTKELIFEDE